jgi:predicted DCC family thiol-disulfide oxidoreductase YuxK
MAMKQMYVLYDGACGVCCRAVSRLANEPAYVRLSFAPAGSILAQTRFAEALAGETERQVVVVADTGEVYRGTSAWIMVLWALKRWRPLAMRLATPMWRPLAERAIDFIGRNRQRMSEFLGCGPAVEVMAGVLGDVRPGEMGGCADGACGMPVENRQAEDSCGRLLAARARSRAEWALDVLKNPPA